MVYIKFNAISRFCYLAVVGVAESPVTNGFSAKHIYRYVPPASFNDAPVVLILKPLERKSDRVILNQFQDHCRL